MEKSESLVSAFVDKEEELPLSLQQSQQQEKRQETKRRGAAEDHHQGSDEDEAFFVGSREASGAYTDDFETEGDAVAPPNHSSSAASAKPFFPNPVQRSAGVLPPLRVPESQRRQALTSPPPQPQGLPAPPPLSVAGARKFVVWAPDGAVAMDASMHMVGQRAVITDVAPSLGPYGINWGAPPRTADSEAASSGTSPSSHQRYVRSRAIFFAAGALILFIFALSLGLAAGPDIERTINLDRGRCTITEPVAWARNPSICKSKSCSDYVADLTVSAAFKGLPELPNRQVSARCVTKLFNDPSSCVQQGQTVNCWRDTRVGDRLDLVLTRSLKPQAIVAVSSICAVCGLALLVWLILIPSFCKRSHLRSTGAPFCALCACQCLQAGCHRISCEACASGEICTSCC
jgi:hypothetical protein